VFGCKREDFEIDRIESHFISEADEEVESFCVR
jgi:hypothetical protein